MNNMRRGFTMIELIFVIVIIGILAAVAIPKLAATRSDAAAAACAHEASQLISEIGAKYTKVGYTDFIALTLGDVTNISAGTTVKTGIRLDPTTVIAALEFSYYCDGGELMTINRALDGTDYNMTVAIGDLTPATPALTAAAAAVTANILQGGIEKKFKL